MLLSAVKIPERHRAATLVKEARGGKKIHMWKRRWVEFLVEGK